MYIDPKVVGVGILEKDHKILLVKRGIEPGYGKWSMPSGYINRFEKVESAIERELKEECGIEVKTEWLSNVYSDAKSPIILLVFSVSFISGIVKPLDETLDAKFFDINQLPEIIDEAINTEVNIDYLDKYLTYLDENTFDFDLFKLHSDIKDVLYLGGQLIDNEIDPHLLEKLMKSHEVNIIKLTEEHVKKL